MSGNAASGPIIAIYCGRSLRSQHDKLLTESFQDNVVECKGCGIVDGTLMAIARS